MKNLQNLIRKCRRKTKRLYMIRKNVPTLTRIEKEKPEDCVDIADRKIDEKPPNPVRIEEENRS